MCQLSLRNLAVLFVLAASGLPACAAQPKDAPKRNEKTAALQQAMLDAARRAYEHEAWLRSNGMIGTTEKIALWSRRWLEAQLDLTDAKADRIKAYSAHFIRMQDLERRTALLVKAGVIRGNEADMATYFRLQAEIWREQAGAK